MGNVSGSAPRGVEPLHELAHFAWEAAPRLCDASHQCQDYHRAWSLVRLLVGQGRLPAGVEFFERELARLMRHGARRVLVSGGADSGVAALVLQACRGVGVEPEIVFADRCATACELNRKLADALDARIEIVAGDIRALDIAPVDVVVAHTFLPFFEGDSRQQVLEAWARNGKVGAELLMSNVLKADEADWMGHKDDDAIRLRAEQLEQAALLVGHAPATAREIALTAGRLWRSVPTRPPGLTEANLRAGLERAGFGMISVECSERGAFDGPLSMAHQRFPRQRAEIRAVRLAGR